MRPPGAVLLLQGAGRGVLAHGLPFRSGMTVAFLGTKGGTGTTTMTVNIGAELHRLTGRSTVLMDLKPAPGDVALFLGLRPRQTLTSLLDRAAWHDEDGPRSCACPHPCGVDVLAAGEEWGRPAARDAEGVEAVLYGLRRAYELVVIDAGSTLTPTVAATLPACDAVVLVANPDVPCLRNVQRLVDAVRLEGVPRERLRLLLNRATDYGAMSVLQIAGVLGCAVDWRVTSDYRIVAAAVTSGAPVRSLRANSELQRHLEDVARSLSEEADAWSMSAAMVAPSDDPGASQ